MSAGDTAGAGRAQAVGYLDGLAGWLEQHGGFFVEREYDGVVPCVRVGADGSGATDEITAAPMLGYGGLWAFHMAGERLGLCDPVSGVGLLLLLRADVPLRRMYRLALREALQVGRR